MKKRLLKTLSELAQKRAANIREEAEIWDILSRDLKRETKNHEEKTNDYPLAHAKKTATGTNTGS